MSTTRGTRLTAKALVQSAASQLEELLGVAIETASGLERDGDGWRVLLEVEEVPRIPASTSLMASYEAHLDADGELLEYTRCRRYHRNQADGQD